MNPADQPQSATAQRAAEPPTLWLSLALGSILIHLVLFILASLVSNHTAKVQLDIEPIAVEFVDPKAVRSTASSRAIAVRPGKPSSTQPSSTQIQPNAPQQPSSLNQPIEQPFVPLQPVKPVRPRQPQTHLTRPASPQQPLNSPTLTQPNFSSNSSQGGSLGTSSQGESPGTSSVNGAQQTSGLQQPATSTNKIAEPPLSGDFVVDEVAVSETDDRHKRQASIESPSPVQIQYSPLIAQALKQGITIKVRLTIDQYGVIQDIGSASLLPAESAIVDQATLDRLANDIFKSPSLKVEPAQDAPDGSPSKPLPSDPTITARIRLL